MSILQANGLAGRSGVNVAETVTRPDIEPALVLVYHQKAVRTRAPLWKDAFVLIIVQVSRI